MAIEHFSPTCIYPDNETIRSATIVKRVCCLLPPPLPPPPKRLSFEKGKRGDSSDPNPWRGRGEGGGERSRKRRRRCTGKWRARTWATLGNLHIDLPGKCVIHGSRTSQKQKLIRAILVEPIWIETPSPHTHTHIGGREGWKCEQTTAWDGQVNETWRRKGRNLCVEWTEGEGWKDGYKRFMTRQHVDPGRGKWICRDTLWNILI